MSKHSLPPSLSFEELKTLTARIKSGELPWSNLIPISKTIVDDTLSPTVTYLKVRRGPYSFLIESVFEAENINRLSFIGTEPYKIIKTSPSDNKDPLIEVENELKKYKIIPLDSLSNVISNIPGWSFCEEKFMGGAFGFVSYDAVRHFEPRVQPPTTNALNIPESVFMFCDSFVVYDNVFKSAIIVYLLCLGDPSTVTDENLRAMYDQATTRIEELETRLYDPHTMYPEQTQSKHTPFPSVESLNSNVGKDGYMKVVEKMKEHIVCGDIIQVVPSHRISYPTSAHPFNIYREMRCLNPSPYMFYVDLDDFQLVGASPECLVSVSHDGFVQTHPIAGTRPRGKNKLLDQQLEKELLGDEKERAEHIMLVDLGRNDVNRVAIPASVKVDALMTIERYSHVMHIVSKVTGKLRPEKTPFDAFRSIFPAGTLSGAPKVKAMQLIAEMEPDKRGAYGGAVGYASFNQSMDWCIAIRMLVIKDGVAYLQAGAGVVYDSDPLSEYKETVVKMMGALRAVHAAEGAPITVKAIGPLYSVALPRASELERQRRNSFSVALKSNNSTSSAVFPLNKVISSNEATRCRVLLIDNYDSFTYNLYQYLCELRAHVFVARNDQITLAECEAFNPTHVVISPGPGHPDTDSGLSMQVIQKFGGLVPVLGVCLGHQAMISHFGGKVIVTGEIKHGKTSPILHDGKGLFAGVPSPFEAIRYHSLAGEESSFPHNVLEITARTPNGIIQAIRHKQFIMEGVQFHPESIKTEYGMTLLDNFLNMTGGLRSLPTTQTATSTATTTSTVLPTGAPTLNTKPNPGITKCIQILSKNMVDPLPIDLARVAMGEIMQGSATPAQISAFLVGLTIHGAAPEIVHALSEVLLQHAEPCNIPLLTLGPKFPALKNVGLLDIVGTGGDGKDSFNVSTASCFVLSACGALVAKHGNRSSSGSFGSTDFLLALGAKAEQPAAGVLKCITECGFGYMHAPVFHPSMRHAGSVRKELPVRTVFNILGPLTNPSNPSFHVIGVGSKELAEKFAELFRIRHTRLMETQPTLHPRSAIIHSHDGMDEVSPATQTDMWVIENGVVKEAQILDPETDFGVVKHDLDDVCGGTPQDRVSIFKAIINNEIPPHKTYYGTLEIHAVRDFILINSAVGLYVVGLCNNLKEGVNMARNALANGDVAKTVANYVAITNKAL